MTIQAAGIHMSADVSLLATPQLSTGTDVESRHRPTARRRASAWAATVAATAVSTYALDVWSAFVGLLLAASGVLSGATNPWLLLGLGCSYAFWGLGLRSNLRANADLLESTGTSTNAFSKAAFDLSRRWSTRPAIRRTAAGVGYVTTEIVKEAPYYLGAFIAALSDAVSAQQAIIFLIGANVGAAGYEYGLARLTRAVLERHAGRPAADRKVLEAGHAEVRTPRAESPSSRPGRAADRIPQVCAITRLLG